MAKKKTTKKVSNKKTAKRKNTKKNVIEELFTICKKRDNFIFNNDLVKKVVKRIKPGTNAYDMTKVDSKDRLPELLIEEDYAIIHKGDGYHQFVLGIDKVYHKFEKILDKEKKSHPYKPSLLNDYSTSESSVLSLSYNQGIIQDFFYPTHRTERPNLYNSERKTKVSFDYKISGKDFSFTKLQIEIDLTLEKDGKVIVFEGKNTEDFEKLDNFNVFQLYNPFRYYYNLKTDDKLKIKDIETCYMLRKKTDEGSIIRVYNYTFTDPNEITSIKLLKKKEYHLIKEQDDE